MCIDAQNEIQSEDVSSTETNRACANNVTDGMNDACQLDTVNVRQSLDVVTETEYFNGTTEIMSVESTLSTEMTSVANETESDLPVTISTVKSEIQKTEYSYTTTQAAPATTQMVAVSNEICTCDLNVCICNSF
jgi:hypothetical protein